MTTSDKRHFIVIYAYAGLLLISLVVFLKAPNGRRIGGVDWNGLFQCIGPTVGTLSLVIFTTVQMIRERISLACGAGSFACLIVVSFICLVRTIPILMHI